MKVLRILLPCLLTLLILCGCSNVPAQSPEGVPPGQISQNIDYAGSVELSMAANTAKTEVTVKSFIDGDTVHFYVPEIVSASGVLKARFLGVDTPESTGKIEEYGKAAARFTREKLENAVSIYVESDDANWNLDSTGDRNLVWVWYQTAENTPYRNLNIELLQNGLAVGSSAANNRYGSACSAALSQAMAEKLCVFSGEKDPEYYYGDAVELTLAELRSNIEEYNGIKVAFNGIVTLNSDNSVYVESYDASSGLYYGMTVYYGFNLSGGGLEILAVGNEVRIVGTVQYYEVGKTWQVSGLTYRQMKPNDPGNIQKISDGHSAAYVLTDADTFVNGKVDVIIDEVVKAFDYAELALSTSVAMQNLTVKSIYTTTDDNSSSKGAMTLTCEADGVTVFVRTAVLRSADGKLITADAFMGKTIDIKGIVDFYDGAYQIKVFTADSIIVKN